VGRKSHGPSETSGLNRKYDIFDELLAKNLVPSCEYFECTLVSKCKKSIKQNLRNEEKQPIGANVPVDMAPLSNVKF
jgi:hypothetical protein